MPKIILLNDNWRFSHDLSKEFQPVRLPHDWLIGNAGAFYKSGEGRYEREIDAGFFQPGQRLFLRFDGVYMDSSLFVDEQLVGEWKNGYTAFEHDITDYLHRDGPSTLRLTVNYHGQSARWYTGAGIYRDVWLIVRNTCHFKADGIYVTTKLRDGRWTWEAEAEAVTDGRPYEVRHTLLGADGEIEAWDIDHPRLYTLRSELIVEGRVEDTVDTRFGFREIEFTAERGFFLNGRTVKWKGVCLHHDLGALGAAFSRDAARRQLETFRVMGVNAIRTAHNPPASAFLDLCDEMGFLVMNELTDIWTRPKTPGDYARFFEEWIERDAAAWVRRDRNHPCVILWSVGNEIHDTHVDAEGGTATLRRLIELVKCHDPKWHAYATLCSNYMPWENTQKCADIIKLIGYNYGDNLYQAHHAAHPDWIVYGSETCATVQSRGVYRFPLSKAILADDDLQCSALGNSATSWGAKSVEACIRADFNTPFSLGQFIWAGQDYIGEPTPYHTKNAYLGHVDTAGFPKDSYFIFKAAWTDYKTAPFVHVYPYWDFSPGQVIDVRVCSNAPRVALFLNGKCIGEVDTANQWVASWQVPYCHGILRAEAYDDNGAVIASMERASFGDAAALQLETTTYGELDFVAIAAVDQEGRPVENANHRVRVCAKGGTLLALDNGDATDYESYHADSRRLFGGKLLAIVRRDGAGELHVTAEPSDVPIRKIELLVDGFEITAKPYPANATYGDLQWRLTDAGGIDSPLGTLCVSEDGKSASVTPKGDGTVYVRCSAKNGRDHITLISQREIVITGMGKPFLDPYSFISGGLYGACNVEPTNGNERGVATLRDGETHVGFVDLDFGAFGSDEITLGLFPLSGEPFEFEMWENMPLDGGEKLYAARYDKGSVWNTYMDVTYRLPRRLRGVTTLCLVFRQKVHIKGFRFERHVKAFERLYAAESDGLYGDAFTVRGRAVEGIGNNVSIVYKDMDFGETGTAKVLLRWRSRLPKNAVRFDFENIGGEIQTHMLDVPRAEEYTEAVFDLPTRVFGMNTVTLVFLPGSKIDLEWVEYS